MYSSKNRRARPLKLTRRSMLASASATMCLPLLEAMTPSDSAFAAGEGIKERLFFIYCPTGHKIDKFRATGANFSPSPFLAPLEEAGVWEYARAMVTNLDNMGKLGPTHPRESASYLTCYKNDVKRVDNRTSVDQYYADHVGQDTILPSLEIGMDDGKSGSCGKGAPCTYNNTISWRESTPNPPIPTAQAAMGLLFKGLDPGASGNAQNEVSTRNASIIDFVLNQSNSLVSKLGQGDKHRFNEYLESVRKIEQDITETSNLNCTVKELTGKDSTHPTNVRQHFEVAALAFQCDATRVGSFMFGSGGSNRPLDFIGGNMHHHGASHNDRGTNGLFEKMSVWQGEQFAYFLKMLKDTPEGSGNLLDNTTIQYGSGMSDNHNCSNLTMVYVGGSLPKIGKVSAENKKLAGLYADLLQHLGVPMSNFRETAPLGILG